MLFNLCYCRQYSSHTLNAICLPQFNATALYWQIYQPSQQWQNLIQQMERSSYQNFCTIVSKKTFSKNKVRGCRAGKLLHCPARKQKLILFMWPSTKLTSCMRELRFLPLSQSSASTKTLHIAKKCARDLDHTCDRENSFSCSNGMALASK